MIFIILIITALYVLEIISHEKCKKKLKDYVDRFGEIW